MQTWCETLQSLHVWSIICVSAETSNHSSKSIILSQALLLLNHSFNSLAYFQQNWSTKEKVLRMANALIAAFCLQPQAAHKRFYFSTLISRLFTNVNRTANEMPQKISLSHFHGNNARMSEWDIEPYISWGSLAAAGGNLALESLQPQITSYFCN
jgi:hypothetical protein